MTRRLLRALRIMAVEAAAIALGIAAMIGAVELFGAAGLAVIALLTLADLVFKSVHENEAGEAIKVPNLFLIAVPVFEGGDLYRMAVRLRYRMTGGSAIAWSVHLYRADRVFDHAFDEAVTAVAAETGLPVFRGLPEDPQPLPTAAVTLFGPTD